LHAFVRRPGIESDYHLLNPMEFHADTAELVQMLRKGHYGVKLDSEAWDRLITWIDLNCPFHGTWGEQIKDCRHPARRRRELLKLYAGIDEDPEAVFQGVSQPALSGSAQAALRFEPQPGALRRASHSAASIDSASVPAGLASQERGGASAAGIPPPAPSATVRAHQALRGGAPRRRSIELAKDVTLEMVLVPAGEFVMGSHDGPEDERPANRVRVERPFWIGIYEVTNRQFALFDPCHDSHVEPRNNYQFGVHGIPANRPEQPVVRVSWEQAMAFCRWLAARTGEEFTLPTEAQWEYACRAETMTPFWYGGGDADFGPFANLADAKLSHFALHPYTEDQPLANPSRYDDWIPKDSRFNDGAVTAVAPGRYRPNPWGLYDMHGNVAEWTRSLYLAYPYADQDGRNNSRLPGKRVVRGGSWRDRPYRATASFRLAYEPFQKVFNVGFRVVAECR